MRHIFCIASEETKTKFTLDPGFLPGSSNVQSIDALTKRSPSMMYRLSTYLTSGKMRDTKIFFKIKNFVTLGTLLLGTLYPVPLSTPSPPRASQHREHIYLLILPLSLSSL
jgi:hypothetical protein